MFSLRTCSRLSRLRDTSHRSISTFDSMYTKLIQLPPVHWIEDSLASLHHLTGLPWGVTIVTATLATRLAITLPAHVTQAKVAAKRYVMTKEMQDKLLPALKSATNRQVWENKWSEQKAEKSFARVAADVHNAKILEYNCHYAKLFTPAFIQIPVWVFSSVALRNLSTMRSSAERQISIPIEERFIQLASEGPFFCPNLTLPDPTFLLPLTVGLSFATIVLISSRKHVFLDTSKMNQSTTGKINLAMTGLLYLLAAAMVPIASIQPSAVALYWAASGVAGISINLTIMSPMFRRFVRIPKTPMEMDKPYQLSKENILKSFKSGSNK